MTPQLQAVTMGGLIAGSFLVIGTILGTWLNRSTEHQRWLRQERLSVYTDLLAIATRLIYAAPGKRDERADKIDTLFEDMLPIVHRAKLLTDTAYKEIATIRTTLPAFLVATLDDNQAEQQDAVSSLLASMTDLEAKARQEIKTRRIDPSEIPEAAQPPRSNIDRR